MNTKHHDIESANNAITLRPFLLWVWADRDALRRRQWAEVLVTTALCFIALAATVVGCWS